MNPKIKAWMVDATERVAVAFGVAFVGSLVSSDFNLNHLSTAKAATNAGIGAGLAVLYSLLAALRSGPTISPASMLPAQQPGQAEQDAPPPSPLNEITGRRYSALTLTAHDRLRLLPEPSGRKGGALPSPVDDRDWQAKLPHPSTIPSSVDYGAGIPFGMLLNDRIGDCYEAALLHALQVLTGGNYVPTDADALHVYERVTGYDPTRTDANGNNPTDRGTVGRELFAWAKAHRIINSYAAVPPNRQAVKQAIAGHKAVLCEWALPAGAERDGDVWTMPRTGKAAGSWGYHATVEVGYTSRHNRNVTWGQEGTVTPSFEDAYLQAAWVIEAPLVVPPIA